MEKELNNLLTKPVSYYKKLILKNNPKFDFLKPVILFGAGNIGKELLSFFKYKGTKVIAFSDNDRNKIGKLHCGIKVINKKEIPGLYGRDFQIVASCAKYYEVIEDLRKEGFKNLWSQMYFATLYPNKFNVLVWENNISLILINRRKINHVFKLFKDTKSRKTFINIVKYRLLLDYKLLKQSKEKSLQYFDSTIIKLTKTEVFLDGGAFNGDTIRNFINKTNNYFNKVIAFEPDKANFELLSHYVNKGDSRIKIFKAGVGDREGVVSFSNEGNIQSRIIQTNNSYKINIVPIDKFIEPLTYIKLDIEGYDKQAIKGARITIKRYKPKLAICAYHYLTDLWDVPLLIKKINQNYKLFLRHHGEFLYDTVCYAI